MSEKIPLKDMDGNVVGSAKFNEDGTADMLIFDHATAEKLRQQCEDSSMGIAEIAIDHWGSGTAGGGWSAIDLQEYLGE